MNAKTKDGRTALHYAAEYGRTEVIEFLLGKGAQIDTQDNYKNTPLHVAAEYGHIEAAELLKAAGAK